MGSYDNKEGSKCETKGKMPKRKTMIKMGT